MSGLGFYVDALQHGRADFDAVMKPIAPRRDAAPRVEEAAAAPQPSAESVEAELEKVKKELPALYEAWKSARRRACSRRALKAGSPRSRRTQASSPTPVSRAGRRSAGASSPPAACCRSIRRWCGRSRPSLPAASPRPRPRHRLPKLIEASDETVDAELLAVYLEEAGEVLGTISASLVEAREAPQNVETLRTIRRGFHTLKGSGRMVGLTRLGEAAWAVEQVMNKWLEEERAGTSDLFTLIVAAQDFFGIAVEALKAEQPSPDEAAIVALANKVKTGEPLGEPAAPAAVAVAEAPAIESIEIDLPVEQEAAPVEAMPAIEFPSLDRTEREAPVESEAWPQRRQSRCRRSNRPSSRCAHGRARIRARRAGADAARDRRDRSRAPAACRSSADALASRRRRRQRRCSIRSRLRARQRGDRATVGAPIRRLSPTPRSTGRHLRRRRRACRRRSTRSSRARRSATACAAARLRDGGEVAEEFMRAAHTLAGIAGTVRFDAMRALGQAVEHLLERSSNASSTTPGT